MGSEIVPKLKLIEGGEPGEEFFLIGDETTIGRLESNDLVVSHAFVSGNHARIFKSGDGYKLIDLGSSNGTYVNGNKINSPYSLKSGDVIGLGLSVKLEFVQPEPQFDSDKTVEEVLATSVQDIKSAKTAIGEMPEGLVFDSPPELEVTVAGSSPNNYILDRDVIGFGRSPENMIKIDSPIVSRNHGYFERTGPGSYSLVVLPEAGNPVFVNGRKVDGSVELETDAKIRIGGQDPGMMVSMVYTMQVEPTITPTEINFDDQPIIQIGRDAQNDVVLNVLQVSRFHAQIERVGQRYKVTDLGSTNGTFGLGY
jgi:pSer/pThr/pTyr-binding forkhead associated (FHA) protein